MLQYGQVNSKDYIAGAEALPVEEKEPEEGDEDKGIVWTGCAEMLVEF